MITQYQLGRSHILLDGFLLPQSFKGLAKILGSAIQDHPDLRLNVMASLRRLIQNSINNRKSTLVHPCHTFGIGAVQYKCMKFEKTKSNSLNMSFFGLL